MVTSDRLILHSSSPTFISNSTTTDSLAPLTTSSPLRDDNATNLSGVVTLQPANSLQLSNSANALWKRVEQLRRWQDSETNLESCQPKHRSSCKVNFQQPCVFLAACAAGEKSEILALLSKGVDINTANADGMTALHQACIDGNLEIVKFLHLNGADLNYQDNEGWAPLHAAASCGHLDITRYLVDAGADLSRCTSDREVAVDLADSDEVANYLTDEITKREIDLNACRNAEHELMMLHCKQLVEKNDGSIMNCVDPKTCATVLHIAAAKGYIDVLKLLLEAGCNPSFKDADGWTPLHAAAHWDQAEAAKMLMLFGANCDDVCNSGYQVWDVCDELMFSTLINYKTELKNRNAVDKNITASLEANSKNDCSSSHVHSDTNSTDSDLENAVNMISERSQRDVTTPAREFLNVVDKDTRNNERIGRLQASLRSLSEKFKDNNHDTNILESETVAEKETISDGAKDLIKSTNCPQTYSDNNGPDILPQRDFVASRRNRFEAVAKENALQIVPKMSPATVRSDDDSEDDDKIDQNSSSASDQAKNEVSWGSCVSNIRCDNTNGNGRNVKASQATNARFATDTFDKLPKPNNRFNNNSVKNVRNNVVIFKKTGDNGKPPIHRSDESENLPGLLKQDSKLSKDIFESNKRKKPSVFAGVTAVTVSSPPPLTVTANVSVSTTSSSSTPECQSISGVAAPAPELVTRSPFRTPTKDEQSEAERKKRSARARRERRSTQGVLQSDVLQAFADCGKHIDSQGDNSKRSSARWTETRKTVSQAHESAVMPRHADVSKEKITNRDENNMILRNEFNEDHQLSQKRKTRPIQRRLTGKISTSNLQLADDQIVQISNPPRLSNTQTDSYSNASRSLEHFYIDNCTQTSSQIESYSLQQYQMKFHEKCLENEKLMSELDYIKRELYDKDQIINRLKAAARVDQLDKRKLDVLKSDNVRLKDENAALIRVISKMSKQQT